MDRQGLQRSGSRSPGLLPGRDREDVSAARVHRRRRAKIGQAVLRCLRIRLRRGGCLRRRHRDAAAVQHRGGPLLFLGSVNTVAIVLAGVLAGIGILASIPVGRTPAMATRPPHLRSPPRALGGAHQSRSGCCSADAVGAIAAGAGRADVDPTEDRDRRCPQQNPRRPTRTQPGGKTGELSAPRRPPLRWRDDTAGLDRRSQ